MVYVDFFINRIQQINALLTRFYGQFCEILKNMEFSTVFNNRIIVDSKRILLILVS